MRATNNEKRTPGPVTALTNFAASTILDEKTLLRCSGSLVETTVSVCLSGPPYSTPIVINRNLFMKSALGVSTTP